MSKRWLVVTGLALIVWVILIILLAPEVPADGSLIGFLGTIVTFIPIGLQQANRIFAYCYRSTAPEDQNQFNIWVQAEMELGQGKSEILYTVFYVIGVSGIAIGFLRQYLMATG